MWKWNIKNGNTDWPIVLYHESGSILASWNFQNGLPDWEFNVYHENESIYITWLYENGILNGYLNVYDQDWNTITNVDSANKEIEEIFRIVGKKSDEETDEQILLTGDNLVE